MLLKEIIVDDNYLDTNDTSKNFKNSDENNKLGTDLENNNNSGKTIEVLSDHDGNKEFDTTKEETDEDDDYAHNTDYPVTTLCSTEDKKYNKLQSKIRKTKTKIESRKNETRNIIKLDTIEENTDYLFE
jgi:hypothetical protein